MEEQDYREGHPFSVTAVRLGGYRTVLAVPMLKENDLLGAIASFAKRSARSTKSKLISFRTLPAKLSLPSKIHGY